MFQSPYFQRLLIILALPLLFSACSSLGLDSEPTYGDKEHETLYKNGSLLSDEGGYQIGSAGNDAKKSETGLGVNGFLWRATLDTISFMPIASADPFGGVIITDWYSPPETPNERTKLNIYIRGRDLRADGVKVSVFRQTKQMVAKEIPDQPAPAPHKKGHKAKAAPPPPAPEIVEKWVDASVSPTTAGSLENAILTRARQIRMAQKQIK